MNSIYSYWQMNWKALVSIVLLLILFVRYHGLTLTKSYGFFAAALVLLVLCFFSPLHVLSAHYLFSAHMVVHVILLLIVGPLLVLSLWREDGKTNIIIHTISKRLYNKPVLGWLAGVGIMWFWHLPFVFNYCMNAMHTSQTLSAVLQALESTSLIVAGMLFGWSIISPVKEYRLPALNGVVYLFTACIGCSLLGLLITFAPTGLYNHFLSMHDTFNLNDVILNQWQLNQSTDQQIAGLIMWVPCCLLYVMYALYLLGRWFNEKEVVNVM